MTIKIDKQDAKWLKLAMGKDPDREKLMVVNVCDSKWGHVAVATDGMRLHMMEIDTRIPNGYYMPYASGELKPVTMFQTYPQWEFIVAPDNCFSLPCDTLDKCEVVQMGAKECYAFGKLIVDAKLLNDAVGKGKAYRIDAQDQPTKPVRVKFLGDRTQLAIVMPCRPIS